MLFLPADDLGRVSVHVATWDFDTGSGLFFMNVALAFECK